jgi:hypothetical protein
MQSEVDITLFNKALIFDGHPVRGNAVLVSGASGPQLQHCPGRYGCQQLCRYRVWAVMMLGGCFEYDLKERNDGTFERYRSQKNFSPHLLDLQRLTG